MLALAMMLPAVVGMAHSEGELQTVCEADYDRSKCFTGDVPACGPCQDGLDFAKQMLTTSYQLSISGKKDYSHHLIVTGRIAKVDGLPADLLTRGVDVLVGFEVEHAFVHPTPQPPSVIQIAMDSDMFAWGDSGISRYALRHSVLPYLFYHRNQVGTTVRKLQEQIEGPINWRHQSSPPQVYTGGTYGGDVPPEDSVLATSLPRLRAIETWLESALPDGMNAHVSPDGTSFNQPFSVDGFFYSGVMTRTPRGGGFYDRSGALNPGDRLLIAFQESHFHPIQRHADCPRPCERLRILDREGQLYRINLDPTWQIFWGAEMKAVETALRALTACIAKRLGKQRPFDPEAFASASDACGSAMRRARRNADSTR